MIISNCVLWKIKTKRFRNARAVSHGNCTFVNRSDNFESDAKEGHALTVVNSLDGNNEGGDGT